MVKKEKTPTSLPPNRALVDLTTTTPRSRKRKLYEFLDLILESFGAEEAMKKPISFSLPVSTFEFFFA